MFGYVIFNEPELKIKDYDMYRSWYCGLCRELRERYGIPGEISVSYDLTFVAVLLTALYEPGTLAGKTRCIVQPFVRHKVRKSCYTEYAADMNVLLMYYKCLDDWKDEHKVVRAAYAALLKRGAGRLSPALAKKAQVIKECLASLSSLEKEGVGDIDAAAGIFGKILAEVFAPKEDLWSSTLRRMGFYLGKFVYLLDAYEDVEKDLKDGSYNPLKNLYQELSPQAFEDRVRALCTMMMAEACQAFETLPVLMYGDILRNILYSGVWVKFEAVSKKRREEKYARSL